MGLGLFGYRAAVAGFAGFAAVAAVSSAAAVTAATAVAGVSTAKTATDRKPTAAVATVCVIETPPDAGSWVASRAHRIRFADGREITIVGHDHENRALGGGSATAFKKAVTSARSGAALREAATLMISENPKASADAANDYAHLQIYLRSTPRAFVGVEASPETVRTNLKSYGQVRSELSAKMKKFGESGELFEQAQAYAFGPDFSLKLNEPALFATAELIGIEESALDRDYERLLAPLNQASASLAHARFDESEKIGNFIDGLTGRYPTYRPETDDAAITREASAFKEFPKFSSYLRTRLAMMRAMKRRDRHDAEVILSQKRSGLLLIGRAHLESITALVHDACLGPPAVSTRAHAHH